MKGFFVMKEHFLKSIGIISLLSVFMFSPIVFAGGVSSSSEKTDSQKIEHFTTQKIPVGYKGLTDLRNIEELDRILHRNALNKTINDLGCSRQMDCLVSSIPQRKDYWFADNYRKRRYEFQLKFLSFLKHGVLPTKEQFEKINKSDDVDNPFVDMVGAYCNIANPIAVDDVLKERLEALIYQYSIALNSLVNEQKIKDEQARAKLMASIENLTTGTVTAAVHGAAGGYAGGYGQVKAAQKFAKSQANS